MPHTLVSWNINGFRSILSKTLPAFLSENEPDILCLQEIKCDDCSLLTTELEALGYSSYAFPAVKKGYSGTLTAWRKSSALADKIEVVKASDIGIDAGFQDEGRVVELKLGEYRILNLYVPSGSSSDERQVRKYQFMNQFYEYLSGLSKEEISKLILCGDFNICHQDIDIHHPKKAAKMELSGFLPEEREWFSKLLDSFSLHDSFRLFSPNEQVFTWWSYRAGARGKNLGWRIDYILCGDAVRTALTGSTILTSIIGSDHCPIEISFNLN